MSDNFTLTSSSYTVFCCLMLNIRYSHFVITSIIMPRRGHFSMIFIWNHKPLFWRRSMIIYRDMYFEHNNLRRENCAAQSKAAAYHIVVLLSRWFYVYVVEDDLAVCAWVFLRSYVELCCICCYIRSRHIMYNGKMLRAIIFAESNDTS